MRGISIDRLQVSASMLKGLQDFTSAAGLNHESIARTVGLSGINTDDDFEFVSLDAFAQYLEIASLISGDESFGLRFALARPSEPTGPLSFALGNAPDVRTALSTLAKFIPTRLDVSHAEMIIDGDGVTMDWGFSPLLIRRWQFCDYSVATTVRRVSLILQSDWKPLEIRLNRPEPRNLEPYRRILGRSLAFSQATNSVVFPAAILSVPGAPHNQALYDMSCRLLEKLLADRKKASDLITNAREEIIMALPTEDGAQLQRVARRLAMSPRSLQRHLSEHDTSFQQLVNESRKALAQRYLQDQQMSFSQISYQLGFSAPSAFTRACYRWFGQQPSHVRRALRNGSSAR